MQNLRQQLTFGFEMTFTVPDWWQRPSFCSEWESDEKTEIMRKVADGLVKRLGGSHVAFKDSFNVDSFISSSALSREALRSILLQPF